MKWKCLKCGEEVSIWATVCPHCWRNPGGLLEHLVSGFFKWCFIIGIIAYIPMHILGGGTENNHSVSKPNKQFIETQEQVTTKQIIPAEKIDYEEDDTLDSQVQHVNTTSSTNNIEHKTTPIATTAIKHQKTKVPTSIPVQKPMPKPEMDVDNAMNMFNE